MFVQTFHEFLGLGRHHGDIVIEEDLPRPDVVTVVLANGLGARRQPHAFERGTAKQPAVLGVDIDIAAELAIGGRAGLGPAAYFRLPPKVVFFSSRTFVDFSVTKKNTRSEAL